MRPGSRIPAPLRRFAGAAEGAYAVEFALAGSLFIILFLVLCQYALVYMARDSLALALQQATRSLLTGKFQQANAGTTSQTQILRNLQATICGPNLDSKAWMFSCANLKLDVRTSASFASSSGSSGAVDSSTGTWSSGFGSSYTCPGPQSIAVVRAAAKYPVFARGLSFGLGVFSDGSALLQAAAVFRVEPYTSGSGSAC